MKNKKYRNFRRAAAGVCVAVLTAAALAGCSGSSGQSGDITPNKDITQNSDSDQKVTLGDPSNNEAETTAAPITHVNMFDIKYEDYVNVRNWKNAVVTRDEVTPSDYELRYALCYKLENTYKVQTEDITDRGVEAGDTVTIDFTGYIDGEELENGSGTGQTLTIGSQKYIDGYEEGLVGAKVGDEVTLELNFPDPYQNNPELSGKPVTFKVKVTAIKGYKEFTDEMIDEATEGEFKTFDAFYEDFVKDITKQVEELTIWQKVMEEVKIEKVCQELVDDYVNTYLSMINMMASSYGVDVNTFVYYSYGCTLDDFKAVLQPSGEDYAKQSCAVLAIAAMENIEITEDEINTKIDEYYGSEEKMEESGDTRDGVKFDLLLEKVEQHIYDTIQIQE